MSATPTQTIIQQIQPQCDTLHEKIKEQKDAMHETNQSVADHTGIPISNVAKFFSGALANPSVFYTAAMCIFLDLSLDELMGIRPDRHGKDAERIKELERQLERSEHDLQQCEIMNSHFAAGIKERKSLLYGLTALCSILVLSLMAYLMMDASNLNFGFITTEGVSVFGALLIVAVLAGAVFVIYSLAKKTKKNGQDKTDAEKR